MSVCSAWVSASGRTWLAQGCTATWRLMIHASTIYVQSKELARYYTRPSAGRARALPGLPPVCRAAARPRDAPSHQGRCVETQVSCWSSGALWLRVLYAYTRPSAASRNPHTTPPIHTCDICMPYAPCMARPQEYMAAAQLGPCACSRDEWQAACAARRRGWRLAVRMQVLCRGRALRHLPSRSKVGVVREPAGLRGGAHLVPLAVLIKQRLGPYAGTRPWS